MLIADLAQTVKVTLGRRQAAEGPSSGLDKHRRNVFTAHQVADADQIVGEFSTFVGLASDKFILRQGSVPHVVDTGQPRAERAAVVDHSREGNASHVYAVVGAFTRDEELAMALSTHTVVRQCDFHCRVDRFRSRAAKENAIQVIGGEVGDLLGQLKGFGVGPGKGHRVVQRAQLFIDGLGDLRPAVAGCHAKQACRCIDDLVAVGLVQVHALSAHKHARIGFEFLVGRERHPEVLARFDIDNGV